MEILGLQATWPQQLSAARSRKIWYPWSNAAEKSPFFPAKAWLPLVQLVRLIISTSVARFALSESVPTSQTCPAWESWVTTGDVRYSTPVDWCCLFFFDLADFGEVLKGFYFTRKIHGNSQLTLSLAVLCLFWVNFMAQAVRLKDTWEDLRQKQEASERQVGNLQIFPVFVAIFLRVNCGSGEFLGILWIDQIGRYDMATVGPPIARSSIIPRERWWWDVQWDVAGITWWEKC